MTRATWLTAASVSFACLLASPSLRGDEPKKDEGMLPQFLREFRALKDDCDEKLRPIYATVGLAYKLLKTEEEREKLMAGVKAKRDAVMAPAVRKALELVRPNAADPAAVEPLVWLVGNDEGAARAGAGEVAAGLLYKHHLTHPKTLDLAYGYKRSVNRWAEGMLRAQVAADLPEARRPKQALALAMHLQNLAALATQLADAPEDEIARVVRWCGKDRVTELQRLDVKRIEEEAIQQFTELEKKYPKAEVVAGLTIGEFARSSVFEIKNMKAGKAVPEVEGDDLQGGKFRLSDYRGKVVMLVFWASWCGNCLAEAPHERELAERYKGRPFAVVGVNADTERDEANKAAKEHGITWRSYWCGKLGPDGPLPRAWNVHGFPTIYLIDARGVIRANSHSSSTLDARIARLVAEAEMAARPK